MDYSLFKFEIDSKRPSILIFKYWNPIATGYTCVDSSSADTFFVFDWGPETRFPENPDDPDEQWNFEDRDYGIGHAVTGVGYCENFDPDGAGNLFKAGTWVIVHDNWSSTPMNVALPWKHWNATVPVKVYPPSGVALKGDAMKVDGFMLGQNYPNPFNAATIIQFVLPKKEHVKIEEEKFDESNTNGSREDGNRGEGV